MKILVVNVGSSSLKFTLFDMSGETMLAKGMVERIGLAEPRLSYQRSDGKGHAGNLHIASHVDALRAIGERLTDPESGVIARVEEVDAIGHRVVHGGERATCPVLVDDHVKGIIRDCFSLAPLHNPPNMAGIEACEKLFPGTPNVAVFDTAFHHTMPPEAYLYAVPYELYTKYGIRRYGFHGTSHHYVARATAKFLDIPFTQLRMITCHLGNGCSMAAISQGTVLDTSMGLTPLEGLVMGTRCGDIDPAIVLRLCELGMDTQEIDKILNQQSGLLGVSGIGSGDMRDVIAAAEQKGNQQAQRALHMFVRRIVKYVGAYYALLDGADALVFTGGIGEGSTYIRAHVLGRLASLGLQLDPAANDAVGGGQSAVITRPDSSWQAVVIPTNEELMIARETLTVMSPEEKSASG